MNVLPASLDDAFDALVHSSGESESPSERLSPDPPTQERPKRPWQQPEERLRLGERVEAPWSGDQRLYTGHIEALDQYGRADVVFDDGLREARVAPALVHRLRPQAAGCLMPELDAQTRTASPRRLPDFFPFPVIIAPWRLHADVGGAVSYAQAAPPKPRPPPKPPPKTHAATPVPPVASSSSGPLVLPPARGELPPARGEVGEPPATPGSRKPKRAKPSFASEVMLCCHKMPHEGGCFTCTLPFGHLCPHETGPEGPRKRAPAKSRDL